MQYLPFFKRIRGEVLIKSILKKYYEEEIAAPVLQQKPLTLNNLFCRL